MLSIVKWISGKTTAVLLRKKVIQKNPLDK